MNHQCECESCILCRDEEVEETFALYQIDVLDYGYVKHIESWGCGSTDTAEAGIIEAARQSTQGSFRGWEEDKKLLKYLYDHKHGTPFEFAGMVIEVQAPILVFREWHRHRTQSYNEMSSRYSPLPDLNYLPSMARILPPQEGVVNENNRQAGTLKGANKLTEQYAANWRKKIADLYEAAQALYTEGLEAGIPKELARICLPVGRYSRMRACANLRNWLAFLTLRMDPAAQWEIRQFANAVGQIIAKSFPNTWELFTSSR